MRFPVSLRVFLSAFLFMSDPWFSTQKCGHMVAGWGNFRHAGISSANVETFFMLSISNEFYITFESRFLFSFRLTLCTVYTNRDCNILIQHIDSLFCR